MSDSWAFWRRLDGEGHDACRLTALADGWRLAGTAVFQEAGQPPACLAYAVECDGQWCTRQGEVRGWVGDRAVGCMVSRTARGVWTFNGDAVPGLQACLDLDLGFTPATNLFQLRRLALAPGESAQVPVAWLDASADALTLLEQRYERRGEHTYWYEAPRFDYRGLLRIDGRGFAIDYPGLWQQADAG